MARSADLFDALDSGGIVEHESHNFLLVRSGVLLAETQSEVHAEIVSAWGLYAIYDSFCIHYKGSR